MSEPSLRDTAIREAHDHDVPYLGIDRRSFELGAEYGADAALSVIRAEIEARSVADPDPGKEPKSRWERWNLRQRERERLLATLGAEP